MMFGLQYLPLTSYLYSPVVAGWLQKREKGRMRTERWCRKLSDRAGAEETQYLVT
jgi:hypothetical protein